MRHVAPMLLATGLVATMLGCQSQTTEQKAKPGVEYTLVSLKVPNMV
jgi:hypothetical protein